MKDEVKVAQRLIEELDRGLDLPEPVLTRLYAGRQRALDRLRVAPQTAPGTKWHDGVWLSRMLASLALVVAIAISFAGNEWMEARLQAQQQSAELAEIDAAMLSSELPLEAYLDRDFYAWLHASQE
ncbi:MAG TPA: DUF3619 family protein [Burkholderiales bacterium]|jgi:hypothetical protein|nr:DUF3619 family protein [Burkholderiales bacterium]